MTERASVDELRKMVGAQTTKDDAVLGLCLEAAGKWIYDRVETRYVSEAPVVQAVLMLASRLYKRRMSPEGVTGWADQGAIVVVARDPDVDRLIEQYLCAYRVWGIA